MPSGERAFSEPSLGSGAGFRRDEPRAPPFLLQQDRGRAAWESGWGRDFLRREDRTGGPCPNGGLPRVSCAARSLTSPLR